MIEDILARFMRLHPTEIDLSLDRMHRLLADLDHPETRLPPVLHIAGTNGKGSTLAMLRALFSAAGQSVHAYTSPHLVRFAERIRVAGKLINDADLRAVLEAVEKRNNGQNITFFEATTAAALYAFAQTSADVCLLETGLGGRLDATNVAPNPVVSILTTIALDHQDYLGETLRDIALEKAHILRPGGLGVVAPQQEADVVTAITDHACSIDSRLWLHDRDWQFKVMDNGSIRVCAPGLDVILPHIPLPGPHQAMNAALATVAAHASGLLDVTTDLVTKAVPTLQWPGRLQRLTSGKLIPPDGTQIWLDGGHNPSAAEAIAPVLRDLASSCQIDLILGMQTTKDPMGYLRHVLPFVTRVITVPVPGAPAPMSADALMGCAHQSGKADAQACADWQTALSLLQNEQDVSKPRCVLIAGSLYLVGDVLRENGSGAPE